MRAAVLLATLALTACAAAPTTPEGIRLDSGQGLVRAESTLDAAVVAARAAVLNHLTTPAQNAQIAALTAPCPAGVTVTTAVAASCPVNGAVALARQAYVASDAASLKVLIAQMGALAGQLATTHP